MSDFDPTDFVNAMGEHERRIIRASVQAAEQFAEQVMADSQELVPVSPVDKNHALYTGHSGALRDSGTVKDAEQSGSGEVRAVRGGDD